jgi:hypothetical protein
VFLFLSDNQQFLKEILRNVMRGDGVGWLTSKRLKRLMTEEPYRLMVANQLYNTPVASEDESEVMEDVVSLSFVHPLLQTV